MNDTFKFRIKVWDSREIDPNTYQVAAYKEYPNPETTKYTYTFEEVTNPDVGGEYYMFDPNGNFMKWDAANDIWIRNNDISDPDTYTETNTTGTPPISGDYLFTYNTVDNIETADGLRVMQSKGVDYPLYALVAAPYLDTSKYWTYWPAAANHKIAWEYGFNTRDGGASQAAPEEYYYTNLYGIVNPDDGVHTPAVRGEHVKFYKMNVSVVTEREHPEWTHTEVVTKYNFSPVASNALQQGKKYVMEDGTGFIMGWDDDADTFIRKTVDLTNGTTDFSDINYYAFVYPGSGNRVQWGVNKEYLYHETGNNDKLRVGPPGGYYADVNTWGVRYDAANSRYIASSSAGGTYKKINFYEITEEQIETQVYDNYHREYYNFADPNPLDPEVSGLDDYTITPKDTNNNYFIFEAPHGSSSPEDILKSQLKVEDGWIVEIRQTGGTEQYDIDSKLQAAGMKPVKDSSGQVVPDTYEFEIKTKTDSTHNYDNYLELDGIVPLGWNYDIVEIGEDGSEKIGTREGWEFVSKTSNATVRGFDGEEEVKIVNKINDYDLKVEKNTVDDKEGTFEYKVKVWIDGETGPEYMNLSRYGGTPVGDGSYIFKIKNGESFTIDSILGGHKYEVQELIAGRWKLVAADGSETVSNKLNKPGSYKIVVDESDPPTPEEDLTNTPILDNHKIAFHYREYEDHTPSIVLDDSGEKEFVLQYFDQDTTSTSESKYTGKSMDNLTMVDILDADITWDDPVDTSTTGTGIFKVQEKNGGTTYTVAAKVTREWIPYADNAYDTTQFVPKVADLSTMTPIVRMNGHVLKTSGQTGDLFQLEGDNTRLRTGTWGEVARFTETNRTVSYPIDPSERDIPDGIHDTGQYPRGLVTYTYPNAIEVEEGVFKDVVVRVWTASITIPDNATYMSNNCKPAIFNTQAGPQVFGRIMGGSNQTPASYTLYEDINVFIADENGYAYEFPANTELIYGGNNIEKQQTGDGWFFNFDTTISGIDYTGSGKMIDIRNKGYYVITSDTFYINKAVEDETKQVTKDGSTYTFTLEANESFTIPDGVDFTAYKWDEDAEEYVPMKDTVVDMEAAKVSGKVKEDITVSFQNEVKPVVVEKTWIDDDDFEHLRPSALEIKVVTDVPATTAPAYVVQSNMDISSSSPVVLYYNSLPSDDKTAVAPDDIVWGSYGPVTIEDGDTLEMFEYTLGDNTFLVLVSVTGEDPDTVTQFFVVEKGTKPVAATTHEYTQDDAELVKAGNKWTYTFNEIPGAETVKSVSETVPEEYTQTKAPTYNPDTDKWEMENTLKKFDLTIKKETDFIDTDEEFEFRIRVWKEQPETEAFAVYDSADHSLVLFRDEPGKYTDKQVVGTKTYYAGLEEESYHGGWPQGGWRIQSVEIQDIIKPKSTATWFCEVAATTIEGLDKLDTSECTDMHYMFTESYLLTSLDVSHFDTSKVTNMYQMFWGCSGLTSLDLSHFDTSKLERSSMMFGACVNLTATLNVMHMPSDYSGMCGSAARDSGLLTLKYIDPVTSENIDTLVGTASAGGGNAVNGGEGTFTPPDVPSGTKYYDLSNVPGMTKIEGQEVYKFTLKKDGTITVPDIPYGYQYEVWEVDKDQSKVNVGSEFKVTGDSPYTWKLKSATDTTGTLTSSDITSVFKNEVKKGALEVVKKIAAGSPDETFKFRVKFTMENPPVIPDPPAGQKKNSFGFDFSSIDATLVDDDTWEVSITTSNREGSKLFENIPVGLNYEAWEVTADGTLVPVYGSPMDKWKLTQKENAEGRIAAIPEGKTTGTTATFTNRKFVDLTVSKTIGGNMGSKEQFFKFKIDIISLPDTVFTLDMSQAVTTFGSADGSLPPNGSTKYTRGVILNGDGTEGGNTRDDLPGDAPSGTPGQNIVCDSEGKATVYVYLQHNNQAVLKGLPAGSTYTVTELDGNTEGYSTKVDGASGATTGQKTLTNDKEHGFTNTRGGVIPTEIFFNWWIWAVLFGVVGAFIFIRKTG